MQMSLHFYPVNALSEGYNYYHTGSPFCVFLPEFCIYCYIYKLKLNPLSTCSQWLPKLRKVLATGQFRGSFDASSALLLFWQLVAGFLSHLSLDFEPTAMAEFNYTSYLPDYLYLMLNLSGILGSGTTCTLMLNSSGILGSETTCTLQLNLSGNLSSETTYTLQLNLSGYLSSISKCV